MTFIDIGFGNYAAAERILTVAAPETAPIKRLVQEAKDDGRAVDVSCGQKTRSVLITDSDLILLSALTPEALAEQLNGGERA